MHEPGLIFSKSGDARKLYRVSPYLFSQFGAYNKYLLPIARDLPLHGLVLKLYPFDFGISNAANLVPPYGQVDSPVVFGRDLLVWGVTKAYWVQPPAAIQKTAAQPNGYEPPSIGQVGANVTPGFLVNWLHTHNGVEQQWANKAITDSEAAGDGRFPMIFKEPQIVLAGDTITCQLQNMNNATIAAQICFWTGEFDSETYGQEAGQ